MADLPKISKEALREVVSQVVWSYWPYWGTPLMSALLAYAGGSHVADIWLVSLFSFAMISIALNNLSQWMSAQTPAGKVDFLAP